MLYQRILNPPTRFASRTFTDLYRSCKNENGMPISGAVLEGRATSAPRKIYQQLLQVIDETHSVISDWLTYQP
jgi:hypothetical protein